MPGPIGKRDSERTRRNKTNEAGLVTKRGVARGVTQWPDPEPYWHPAVVRMYKAFQDSGMSDFYEGTDAQMVFLACEGMQAWYDGRKASANQFQFVFNALGSLGASEGERRRMRIELDLEREEQTEESAAVAKMAEFRARRGM